MDSFSPHFEDVREEQGVAQRLGYSGPNTLFFDCCFAALLLFICGLALCGMNSQHMTMVFWHPITNSQQVQS